MARTKKNVVEKVVQSAADAVEELGEAATSFKESWSHVQKARGKAKPATQATARAGKQAWSATKKGAKATTRAAARLLPKKKRRKK